MFDPWAVVEHSLDKNGDALRADTGARVTMQSFFRLIRRWCSISHRRRFDGPCPRWPLTGLAGPRAFNAPARIRIPLSVAVLTWLAVVALQAAGFRLGLGDDFHVGYSRTKASGPTRPSATSAT